MKNYPKYVKNTLNTVIRDMSKHPEDFCSRPGKDFTRKRKLPLEKILSLLVKIGGHSLRDEMLYMALIPTYIWMQIPFLPKN